MSERPGHLKAQLVEQPGIGLLLVVLTLAVSLLGMALLQLDDVLHHHPRWPAARPGIELAVVPLAAIAATRFRVGADRLTSLRDGGRAPALSLLMAATLVGLVVYLAWSWTTSLTTFGPDEFGVIRWLGTALAAVFTMIWLPLFPRITATLAGMIAGPTLFAALGYAFFASHMRLRPLPGDGTGVEIGVLSILTTLVWMAGAIWLSRRGDSAKAMPKAGHPLVHAIWIGALMLGLTAWGAAY